MIEHVIEALGNLLDQIPQLRRDRRELHDNALRAVSHALTETYLYYRRIDRDEARDLDVEAQLSKYWSAAAIPLRHLDADLAGLCEHKFEYWLNPEKWSPARVRQVGIGLDEMRHRYRRLLTPNRTARPFPRKG